MTAWERSRKNAMPIISATTVVREKPEISATMPEIPDIITNITRIVPEISATIANFTDMIKKRKQRKQRSVAIALTNNTFTATAIHDHE